MKPEIFIAIITASVTLAGSILTIVYSVFRQRHEDKKYLQQLELDQKKVNFAEKKLAIELFNQRELKIFEARLKAMPKLSQLLIPLSKRLLPEFTSEKALELEQKIRYCIYNDIYHCASTELLQALGELQSSLVSYTENQTSKEKLNEISHKVHNSMHRDLGRTEDYLGDLQVLYTEDLQKHKYIIDSAD